MRWFCIIMLALLSGNASFAQETYGGLMPEFGLTLPINERFSQTYKIENQHFLFRDGTTGENGFVYEYERTDLQFFINYKFAGKWKATVGYQFRIEEQWNRSHRPIQQIATNTRLGKFRLAHRLRLDQTFERNEPFLFRGRYRAALEIPLNGDKIDPKEFYFVISDEPIFAVDQNEFGIENRLVATIGHFFSNGNKLELSIDHRTDKFFDNAIRQRIWLKIGWFVNIK